MVAEDKPAAVTVAKSSSVFVVAEFAVIVGESGVNSGALAVKVVIVSGNKTVSIGTEFA